MHAMNIPLPLRFTAPEDGREARVSQHVAIVRADPARVVASFLVHWLVSSRTKAHLLTLESAGATRKALTKGMLGALRTQFRRGSSERRSFASWLVAEGEDPPYVMAQLGHTDPKVTLGLYARALTTKSRRADRALSGAEAKFSDAETSEKMAT